MASNSLRRSTSVAVAFVCGVVVAMGASRVGAAQTVPQPARIATADHPALDPAQVTLDVVDAPLVDVLNAIAKQVSLKPAYNVSAIPDKRVTMHVRQIPVRIAFQEALRGTGFAAQIQPTGLVLILRDAAASMANGTVVGHVVAAKTKQPLHGVTVTLDDSVKTTRTNDAGEYRFTDVAAGAHRVTVRLVGYGRQSLPVTVTDDHASVVDFALSSSINTLDQVVVTATGAQRYRELGHVVSQINADSLVKEAPVTSISELLTARVPGLAVYTGNGGVVGGNVALRLRGQTTALLDPQPIVIVDGVRYKNSASTPGAGGAYRPFNAEQRSPLNDLNVNDIETVEVVKGPSASALYGPDAANGVIVITTKRGAPGKATWHVYAYPDLSQEPKNDNTTAPGYRAWGHDPNSGEPLDWNCILATQASDNLQCVLDSITVVKTVNNTPEFSVLAKDRPQWHYGANVGGGASALTYFFSGNYDSEVGALQLSPFAAQVFKDQLGTATLSDALRNPNTQQALSLHANVSSQVNAFSTLNFIADYTHANQRAVGVGYIWNGTYDRGVLPLGVDTTDLNALMQYLPVDAFIQSTQEHLNRLVATIQGTTRPLAWLSATASIGTDLSSSVDRGLFPSGVLADAPDGEADDFRRENTGRSASLSLTAVAHPGRMSFRSSVGSNYTYTNLDGLTGQGTGLTPGSTSISTAQNKGLSQEWSETASLGVYGEEVVGFNDRLFLTGSLRIDGSTTFGDAYSPRPYPKAGVSWIVSDEPLFKRFHIPGLDELRVRSSYGAASRYPTSAFKYGSVVYNTAIFDGQSQTIFNRTQLANPLIRPEKTRETEWGADLTLVSNVHLGLTWYNRRTHDQINVLNTPYGFDQQWANVGDLAAHGFEATLGAKLFSTRLADLDLNASYAYNANKVLSLGSATGSMNPYGSLAIGYPLDASIGTAIASFADTANGVPDGIIGPTEVTRTAPRYLGVFYAPNLYTFTPVLSLLGSRLRVSALFDRQSGGVVLDPYTPNCGQEGTCVAAYLKGTPLTEQARLLGADDASALASSDFTRWREFSITGDLPTAMRQKLLLSHASISLQVRNIALWTKYRGPDPESVPGLGTTGQYSAINGAIGIPQGRSWTLRFDVQP